MSGTKAQPPVLRTIASEPARSGGLALSQVHHRNIGDRLPHNENVACISTGGLQILTGNRSLGILRAIRIFGQLAMRTSFVTGLTDLRKPTR
jgi:hypothetical protein